MIVLPPRGKEAFISCVERGSERSRVNPKARLQYLVAGAVAPQDAGYGTPKDRAAIIQKHPKAVMEISENEIAKTLILVLCLVACFPLYCGHYLDDGL